MHYRQYDDSPLVPQNLAVTANNNHPYLTWDFNNEPDVFDNDDAYEIQRRTRIVPGNFGNWTTICSTRGTINSYTDYDISLVGTGRLYQAEYQIKAKDVGNYTSGWSPSVLIYFGQFSKIISNGMQRYEYGLAQNYPNPFNPTTSISYSLKEDGLITLNVYDMLGRDVAELVNENQSEGYHLVEFNAANLPSGIYIYKIKTDEFSAFKKMLLIK